MKDETLKPAEVFPPGEYLREELEARGWTDYHLASRLGLSMAGAGDLLAGRMQITRDLAARLAAAFGTSPELWANLQQSYLEHAQP